GPAGDVMYHNDSGRQGTYAFDLDADGNASNRGTFIQCGDGDGYPDGMTGDTEGCLWIAFWDGWCVRRFSPEGEQLETIRMPIAKPTSCAFGGWERPRHTVRPPVSESMKMPSKCNQMPGDCLW